MKQKTYTRCVRPVAAVLSKAHVAVHRMSGGRWGQRWHGAEVGLLSTVGRRSGQRRTTPLVYLHDGSDIAVVASYGGSDRSPGWWLNLQAHPYAELELAGRRMAVMAERAGSQREARLSARFCEVAPRFADYCARTERHIPVVLLRPVGVSPARSVTPALSGGRPVIDLVAATVERST